MNNDTTVQTVVRRTIPVRPAKVIQPEKTEEAPVQKVQRAVQRPSTGVWKLTLFQKFYDYMAYFDPIVERFPGYERHAWCAQIKQMMIETLSLIISTNRSQSRADGWKQVETNLEVLKVFTRRMMEKRYLSKKTYETASKKLVEMGRITGGLIKSVKS